MALVVNRPRADLAGVGAPVVNTKPGGEEGQVGPKLDPGPGEGSVIQAPNGHILALTWFPYPHTDGADQFHAILGQKESPHQTVP